MPCILCISVVILTAFSVYFVQDTLAQELDFEMEADNADHCRRDLACMGPAIHVPRVERHLSSKRVLTAEFIEGTKINEVRFFDKIGRHIFTVNIT